MSAAGRARILVFAGVLLALLLVAVFRAFLLEPVAVLALRRSAGLDATIGQVGGSLIGGLELRGVSARRAAPAGPLAGFEAARVGARFSLPALLRGREAFLDSLEVTVEAARVELDLSGAPPSGADDAGRPAGPTSLPRLPRLTVSDSQVVVRGRGFAVEAAGLQGKVGRADETGAQAVDLRLERLSLRHPAVREGAVALAAAGRVAPRYLEVTAAQVNGAPLVEHARIALGEQPGDLDVQLSLRLWEGAIEVDARRQTSVSEVRWQARGVDLRPQSILANPTLGDLRGRLSTEGALRLPEGGLPAITGTVSLAWEGAVLAGRHVDHLEVEASAEPGVVRVARAEGRIGPNEVALRPARLPAVPLFEGRWRDLLAASSGAFAASLGDVPGLLALFGVSTAPAARAMPAHRLRLEGTMENGTLRLTRGTLSTGLGKVSVGELALRLPAPAREWGETAFSGAVRIHVPDLGDVSALFPVPALAGSLRGEVSGDGTLSRPEGRASLAGRGISVGGRLLGDVDLEARAAAGTIEVERLQVRRGGSRFTARSVRLSPAALAAADTGRLLDSLAGAFELRSTDIPGLAAAAGVSLSGTSRAPAQHLLVASGAVRGRAVNFTEASLSTAGGVIELRGAQVVLPGPEEDWGRDIVIGADLEAELPDLGPMATLLPLPPLRGWLTARGHLAGTPSAPEANLEASCRGLAVDGRPVGNILLRAALRERRLRVEAIEVARGADRLRGQGSYDLETGTVLEAEAEVTLAEVGALLGELGRKEVPVSGRLHATVRAPGPLPGAAVAIEAELSGGRIAALQQARVAVKGQVTLQGELRQPRLGAASLVGELVGAFDGEPVRAALDAGYAPGQLRIQALELAGAGGLAVRAEGTVPVDLLAEEILAPGPISLRAQARVADLERPSRLILPDLPLTGALRADLGAAGSWKEPEVRLEVHGERLQLPPGLRFAPPGPFTLAGTLTWGQAEARAENVRLESPAVSCSLSGAWRSPPPLPSLLDDAARATAGPLSLRASLEAPDIGWLREAVEGLRGLRGSVAAEIGLEGPPDDPLFSGTVRVSDVALRYRDLPPIDALAARATVARRRVHLEQIRGNVGGAPFSLAGSLDFARVDDPAIDLHLRGTNALLHREEGLRVRADTDLTLRGRWSGLALAGEVALTDSRYEKTFSVARLLPLPGKPDEPAKGPGLAGLSFPEPPLRDMRLDVRLTAREPFVIATNVVRGSARPDLRLGGTGLLPRLSGPILIDTARVQLPSGTLELERGTVRFRESAPDRPELDFGGRMHTRGYEITVQVGGTLDAPEVILSSSPPLPNDELLLLVLTGALPQSAGGESGSATAPLAVYLGRNVLEDLLGGVAGPGEGGLSDRLELQVGRELTRSGALTLDARLLLKTNPVARGSTLYLTSGKDIYDQYHAGLKLLFRFR